MQRRAALMIVATMLGLAATACNLYPGVPATPTLIPTYQTPTPTPTDAGATPISLLPSQTFTPSSTPTASITPTVAPSTTGSSTPTALPSITPTASFTLTPSVTPVITTATFTASPPTLTVTPRPTITLTLVPSITPVLPTASPTATLPATVTPQQVAVTVTSPPTITNVPTLAPMPITFTPLPIALIASQTPHPTASQPPATLERPIIVITSTPRPQLTATDTTPIAIPGIIFTPAAVAIVPTIGFEQLPNGQAEIAGSVLQPPIRDSQGQLVADFDINRDGRQVIISVTGQATINGSPYVGDDKHTRQRFITARWSPDGRYLAYIVERDGAETGQLSWADTIDDGVWILDSAPGSKPKHIYLNTYVRDSNDYPYRVAVGLAWANDSYALLLTVKTVAGLSTVLVGIQNDISRNNEMQPFDVAPGTWLLDNSGWVCTRAENGTVTLGVMDRNGPFTPLLNSLQAGLWIQNPAQVTGGRYAFLGKSAPNGQFDGSATNLQLYVFALGESPHPVSAPLAGEVLSAEWSPNRAALLVHLRTAAGIAVQIVTLDGTISDYTAYANGSSGTHWLR